jgi:isoquinoline 1-oxidoreductase beta subunit
LITPETTPPSIPTNPATPAAIKDCPVFGGKLTSFDAAKVQGMPGVKHVVKVGDSAVAVVADRW